MKLNTGLQTRAQVVAQGEHLTLLVDSPILGVRKAGRVQVTFETKAYKGLGFSLDAGNVLLVIDAPALAAQHPVGSIIDIARMRVVEGNVAFEPVRKSLRELLELETLGSLSNRTARHALLYILEARDPLVRHQRLDALKVVLGSTSE